MIAGIGIDILENSRLESWLDNAALLARYFSAAERDFILRSQRSALMRLTASLAAKEALAKALKTPWPHGVYLREISILRKNTGEPYVSFEGQSQKALEKVLESLKIHLSLSHERSFTVAFVVLERFVDFCQEDIV